MTGWDAASAPLLDRCISYGGTQRISALTLSLVATAATIAFQNVFIDLETEYDAFDPEFEKIVTQAALLLQTLEAGTKHKPTLAFSFDLGVIPPLYLVVIKCRNPSIRKRALQLLKANPRREGVWDSVTAAALGTWVSELEEEGLGAEGFIPEENRVRQASISFDLVERKATMSCWKMNMVTRELVKNKKHITW